ncbi:MAG: HemK/PrmC family methyltransferase, partial [Eubacterium sp.]|nr:HemK/PrmC family methyltransferase [Eubacterium sp.]
EGSDVLDLCTGSGCIAISLAVLGKPRSMTATDVSAEALSVAKQNAEANGAGNKYTAVEFKQGDLWEAVTPAADAQVAGQAAEQAAGQAAEQAAGTQVVEQPAADACAAGSIEPTQFDLITCNPPYIRRAEIPTLMPEVQEYEPILALDGGEDGLDFYRRLVAGADAHLRENGRLICEIGYDQGEAVATLMRDAGLTDVQVKQDLAGLDRLVSGRKPVA